MGHRRAPGQRRGGHPRARILVVTRTRPLTPREHEVAMLVARGYTNAQIARELALAEGTVANHIQDILDRLHLVSRTQISAWAVEQGLIAIEDRHLATLERLLEI